MLRCKAADARTDAMTTGRKCVLAPLNLQDHLVPPVGGVRATSDDSLGCRSRCDDHGG
jgi:hypothetical protein